MREIKFRYRIKNSKTSEIKVLYMNIESLESGRYKEYFNVLDYKILSRDEYANRKDRKGVSIYVGDILKEVLDDWHQIFISEVVFIDGCFKLKTGDCRFKEYSYVNDSESEIEIIGNIYNNPELLKEINNG